MVPCLWLWLTSKRVMRFVSDSWVSCYIGLCIVELVRLLLLMCHCFACKSSPTVYVVCSRSRHLPASDEGKDNGRRSSSADLCLSWSHKCNGLGASDAYFLPDSGNCYWCVTVWLLLLAFPLVFCLTCMMISIVCRHQTERYCAWPVYSMML